MRLLRLDSTRITDWPSFHEAFAKLFDFPEYYGRNMDAWIDCMSDEVAGNMVLLEILETEEFKKRQPELFEALVECSAFVNRRCADTQNSRLYLGFI